MTYTELERHRHTLSERLSETDNELEKEIKENIKRQRAMTRRKKTIGIDYKLYAL